MTINSAIAHNTVVDNNIKQAYTKVVKLTYANFGTTPVNTLVARLPADATITRISYSNNLKLAGNSISAATLSLGYASAGTNIVNAFDVFTTVGTYAPLSPIAAIMHEGQPTWTELSIWAQGSATTGDPTSGIIYLIIDFVR